MERKVIEPKHHVCDYTCMWNGIEDLYMNHTKEEIPDWFFFCLSGVANHVYLKSKQDLVPRRLCVGDGRPYHVYPEIAMQIGMDYHITDGCTYEYAFKKVKKEIDEGHPVVLGPLDMYHLPYLKMYHRFHIPIHYILMTGYDETRKCIYGYDCGREELQTVPYEDLKLAWEVEKGPVGDKHGFVTIRFEDPVPNVYEIAAKVLPIKAEKQLEAKPEFVGISALRKAAREFSDWESELTGEAYHEVLIQLLMSIATVPKYPNRLIPGQESEPDVPYQANCDKMAAMLYWLDDNYNVPQWKQAAELFAQSGLEYEKIFDSVCNELQGKSKDISCVPDCLLKIADLEEEAYKLLSVARS